MANRLKIKITGSSGYLGQLISKELIKKGHDASGIAREVLNGPTNKLADELRNSDVVINLAGSPILQRWTTENKRTIFNSRVLTTQHLVRAIQQLPESQQPKKVVSASAVGIYKPGILHDETSVEFDNGFLGSVVKNWEKPFKDLPEGVQKVVFRLGVVIGKEAKSITNLMLPFKLGLGSAIGNGKQAFPFVHEKDATAAFCWAAEFYPKSDTFNLVAPVTATNLTFTKTLAKQLRRPALFFVPAFVLQLVLGKAFVLLTESPIVSSKKITDAGFQFAYPDIKSALKEILG